MSRFLRNILAVLKGNVICAIYAALGRCRYKKTIRALKHADVRIDKEGKLIIGERVVIGEYCLIAVRSGATIKFGNRVSLNRDCKFVSHERIEIGDDTIFGPNVMIYDHDHLFNAETGVNHKKFKTSEVIIGKNCWIGANTVILRGSHIGDRCVVGAGSVVKGDFPAGAKIIQKRTTLA